jgi:hypothetical protein
MAGDRTLEVQLTARDNLTDVTQRASQSIRLLGDQTSTTFAGMGRAAEQGAEGIQRASQSSVDSLSGIERMSIRLVERLAELFAIHEMVAFTEAVVDAGAKFVDLSEKTGLSITYLEQIKPVADKTGSSVDEFAQAIYRMGVNIQDGTTKAKDGLSQLVQATGNQALAWDNLKNMSPEEQFKAIIGALTDMDDVQRANAIGAEIFGRQYQTMAAAVHNGTLKLAEGTKVAGEETIKALKGATDAWVEFKDKAFDASEAGLGAFILALQRVKDKGFAQTLMESGTALDAMEPHLQRQIFMLYGPEGLAAALGLAAAGYKATAKAAQEMRDAVPLDDETEATQKTSAHKAAVEELDRILHANDETLQHLSAAERAHMDVEIASDATAKQLVDTYGISDASATKLIETHKKAAEEAKKSADATAAAAEAHSLFGATLEAIFPDYDKIATDLSEHILSEEQIAKNYHISEVAVKAVAEAEKLRAEQGKTDAKDFKKDFELFTKGWEQHFDEVQKFADQAEANKEEATFRGNAVALAAEQKLSDDTVNIGLTTYEKQRQQIVRWTNTQLSQLGTDDKNYDEHADRIVQIQHKMIAELGPPWIGMVGDIAAGLQSLGQSGVVALAHVAQAAGSVASGLNSAFQAHKQIQAAAARGDVAAEINGWVSGLASAVGQGLQLRNVLGGGALGNIAGGAETGMAIGTMIAPGIGTAIGAGIGAAAGGIASLFGNAARDSVTAFANANGGFDALHAKLLTLGDAGEYMWRALTQGSGSAQHAIDMITTALDKQDAAQKQLTQDQTDQNQALNDLNADIQKYHVTIQQLGPAWKQQNLTLEAKDLIGSYTRLKDAGVDVKDVISDMSGIVTDADGKITGFSGGLNQLLNDAITTGAALPDQFKPILQMLIDNGQAVDGTGQKIKDLSNVKFSQSLDEQFDTLIGKIDKLITALTQGLYPALDGIAGHGGNVGPGPGGGGAADILVEPPGRPSSPSNPNPTPGSPTPQPGDSGGYGDSGIIRFGTGGYVPHSTFAMVGDAPGGEFINTSPQLKAIIAQALAASSGGGDTYQVVINAKTDDPREHARQFIAEVQNNRGGTRTALRTAIGVSGV